MGSSLRIGIRLEVGPRCWFNKLDRSSDQVTFEAGMDHYPKQFSSRLRLVNTLYQSPGSL